MSSTNPAARLKTISPSQYIFGIQSVPLLASGIYSLIWPSAFASLKNSPVQGVNNGTVRAMALTSISLGTFYAIATYQNNIPMMIATVPGRLLASLIFSRSGEVWQSVAPFEGFMSLLTAMGVYWDWYITRSARDTKKKEDNPSHHKD